MSIMRSLSPAPFRRPFSAEQFAERDTIPCPAPSSLDLVAEGAHVDLSRPESASVVAMLAPSEE